MACLLLWGSFSTALANKQDTLTTKSSQELLVILSQLIEKHANFDVVFGKITYFAMPVPNAPSVLAIREIHDNTSSALYWIDFSKVEVGKNVRFKDWKQGRFALIFSKEVAQKGEKRKPKKFELFFMADKRKQKTDYYKLQELVMAILKQLEKKL